MTHAHRDSPEARDMTLDDRQSELDPEETLRDQVLATFERPAG